MSEQLFWIEACLKLGSGLALIAAPRPLARLLGLPSVEQSFWPRLLGALLTGLGVASLLEVRMQGGLGLAGSIAVNLALAAMIGALLALGRASTTRRGRFILWVVAAALVILSLVEIAYAAPVL